MQLVFDIEADNFLDKLTRIHCIVTKDVKTGEMVSYRPHQINDAIKALENADEIIGHNVIGYDVPAIQKLYFKFKPKKVTDTLVLSRLIWPNIKDKDFLQKPDNMPTKLYGRYSLAAWGYRLGNYKENYADDFTEYNEEMLTYCQQDVSVTNSLFTHCRSAGISNSAEVLEHNIAEVCSKMEATGFHFNTVAAADLYGQLAAKRDIIKKYMEENFEGTIKTFKTKPSVTIPFNPSSRQQIANQFINKYQWKPKDWTPAGQPRIDEETLSKLDYPEAKQLAEYFLLEKRIGMIAEGNNGYLRLIDGCSKLRGRYITNGAITGRATHFSPNLAQVPSLRVPYGSEIRKCFTVPDGWSMVGCDLSGIELRCLAHYLSKWDKGDYANIILSADIHTENQEAAGLPDRYAAKKFIYTLVYGGGDQKLGEIIGKGRDAGRLMKNKFFKSIPAFNALRSAVESALDIKGHLIGLDGRLLYPRSQHAALNTLLQSAGALIAKQWLIIAFEDISKTYEHGWGNQFVFSGWIHDEVQVSCRKEIAEYVGNRLRRAAEKAGEHFKFRCKVDAEYGIGTDWSATH